MSHLLSNNSTILQLNMQSHNHLYSLSANLILLMYQVLVHSSTGHLQIACLFSTLVVLHSSSPSTLAAFL